MTDEDKVKILKHLQNILLTEKRGIPVEGLNREYRNLIGEHIPYRQFGFYNLYEFLDSAKDYLRVSTSIDGSMIARALVTEENQHMAQMISQQRDKKKRKAPQRPHHLMSRMMQDFRQGGGMRGGSSRGSFRGGRGGSFAPSRFGNGFGVPQRFGQPQTVVGQGFGRPQGFGQLQAGDGQWFSRPQGFGQPPLQAFGRPGTMPPHQTGFQNSAQRPGMMTRTTTARDLTSRNSPITAGEHKVNVTYYPKTDQRSVTTFSTTKQPGVKTAEGVEPEPPSSHPPSANSTVSDAGLSQILARVVDYVSKVPNGLWSTRIEVEYTRARNKKLPDDWSQQLEQFQQRTGCAQLSFERVSPERCLVKRCSAQPQEQQQQQQRASVAGQEATKVEVHQGASASVVDQTYAQRFSANPSISQLGNRTDSPPRVEQRTTTATSPSAWRSALTQPKLPKLVLPDDEYLEIFVNKVISASEVRVRLFGEDYNEALETLLDEMDQYYESNGDEARVNDVKLLRIYAARCDQEWQRVKVTTIQGDLVKCDLIDEGDEEILDIGELRELHPKFLKLAAQATTLKLAGLENIGDNERVKTALQQSAQQTSCVAQVHSRRDDEVSIILFDTSENSDFNINQALIELLKQDGLKPTYELNPSEEEKETVEVLSPINSNSPSHSNSSVSTAPEWPATPPVYEKLPKHLVEPATPIKLRDPLGFGNLPHSSPKVKESLPPPAEQLPAPNFANSPEQPQPSVLYCPISIISIPELPLVVRFDKVPLFPLKEIGADLDIHTTVINSPSDFVVQSLADQPELEKLYKDMDDFYNDHGNYVKVRLENIKQDKYYAACIGPSWYRVKLTAKYSDEEYQCLAVDYGDSTAVCLKNLQPLWPNFRHLPIMSIRAAMAGLLPKNGNTWSTSEIEWFRKRVQDKLFVSFLHSIDNKDSDVDRKIQVSLIDTSEKEDVNVAEEMVAACGSRMEENV